LHEAKYVRNFRLPIIVDKQIEIAVGAFLANRAGSKNEASSGKRVGDFGPFLNCCLLL
jgi:hypothetical protein